MNFPLHTSLKAKPPIEQARARMYAARSAWAAATVRVSQRAPGAADDIPAALADLLAAFEAWDDALAALGK
jgi:hypothetical protein